MYECYANANLKKNNFGHRRQKELTQGPCQTNSLRLSLLHPDLFRYKLGVGISIRIDPNFNSSIGIKVKNLYQLMNKCHGSCAFGTDTFCLEACFKACNLKQFGLVCLLRVFKTWLGFLFYMWRSLDETLNIFAGLDLFKNFAEKLYLRFLIGRV